MLIKNKATNVNSYNNFGMLFLNLPTYTDKYELQVRK